MRVSTLDPISMNDVTDTDNAPFVLEGEGENALKIYFENEANKAEYLGIETEHPGEDFEHSLDNPAGMGPGDMHK